MERRRNRVRDSLSSVRDRVIGPAEDSLAALTSRTSDSASGVGDAVRSAPESARAQAQGRPLLVGAVAFGAGFLAAVAFPGTRTEGQMAQAAKGAMQPLADEAGRIGHEVASSLQQPAQQAAEQLKETAAQGVQQVKETAEQRSQETKAAAATAAEEVKGQASTSAQQVKGQASSPADQGPTPS
jgi:hypothetical protein